MVFARDFFFSADSEEVAGHANPSKMQPSCVKKPPEDGKNKKITFFKKIIRKIGLTCY